MVEVLVALGVLSMGLLGIAQLLVHGMRTSHSALLRTQAVNLVADMAERIRANPLGAGAYACASYPDGAEPRGCSDSSTVVNCTAQELAEDDLAHWQEAVRTTLPISKGGTCAADVQYTAGAVTDRYRVSISWLDAGSSQPLSEQAEVVVVRPALEARR